MRIDRNYYGENINTVNRELFDTDNKEENGYHYK